MVLALIIGYLAGAAAAFFLARAVLGAMATRFGASPEQRRSVFIVGGIFGAMSFAPSIFLSMMIGGGSLGRLFADMLPVLSVVIMLVVLVTVTAVATAAGVMGFIGARSLSRQQLPPPRTSR
jgi:hypothetical protein